MSSGASVKGVREMIGKFAKLRKQFPDHLGLALRQETEIEATEVKRRTPVDKGNLRASEHVTGPDSQGRRIWCTIIAGGISAPYAVYVHENLTAYHKVGQAKFIESVILESRKSMAGRVAARIKFNKERYDVA